MKYGVVDKDSICDEWNVNIIDCDAAENVNVT